MKTESSTRAVVELNGQEQVVESSPSPEALFSSLVKWNEADSRNAVADKETVAYDEESYKIIVALRDQKAKTPVTGD